MDISYVNAGESLSNFSAGLPTSLSGTLSLSGSNVTTTLTNDSGAGRISFTGLNTKTFSFTMPQSAGAIAIDRFGITASAVPEPLTILGAITAAGFGVGFKRKLAKNQQEKDQKDA